MQRIERLMLRLLPLVLFVTCVVVVALAILIQRNNENIENLKGSTRDVSVSVDHLEDFVADLEEETPDERARSEAITEAVRQVPEIRDILCEQFPEATACSLDSSP